MNISRIFHLGLLVAGLSVQTLYAQQYQVGKNAHSHNDYMQVQPFYTAYANRFASIEIDVYQDGNNLYVSHDRKDIDTAKTIERLYLNPLFDQLKLNGGKPYPEGGSLQFMIDFKTAGSPALKVLEAKLKPYRRYFDVKNNPDAVRIVLSGAIPPPAEWKNFDGIFFFDGRPGMKYTEDQQKRVAFYSTSFEQFSKWNGLGRMVAEDYAKVVKFVDSVHAVGKPVRFWGCPDTKTCWQAFMKIGVDYLNTDHPAELAKFLNTYPANFYKAVGKHEIYKPTFKTDALKVAPKNVILLISDGAGFSQLWAAATANGGQLNVTQLKQAGYSNTVPANDYNTDSAAGATAMSIGEKTNNRFIGMSASGQKQDNIVEKLSARGLRCGIVSNDKLTGATPSSFFAHQTERDWSDKIAADVVNSPAALIIGGYPSAFDQSGLTEQVKAKGFEITKGLAALKDVPVGKRVICFDNDRAEDNFRLIEPAFDEAVKRLGHHKKGFFLMIEGAKIDGGGHSNKISQCIDEYLSFDRLIGKAIKFADEDKETLVLITSDHETGGLIVVDGNYQEGTILGSFTTTDHTGLPVPLFSYGPGSAHFRGFLQNADIPNKILELIR